MKRSQLKTMLLGSGLSVLGSEVLVYVLSLLILNSSHSAIYFSISLVASPIMSLLFLPFVGPIIDCFDKRKIIFLSQLFCILSLVLIGLTTVFSGAGLSLFSIFVLNAILTITDDFTGNTMFAATITLVSEDELATFRGLDQTIKSAISLISPMIGVVLFSNLTIFEIIIIEVLFETGALVCYLKLDFNKYLSKATGIQTKKNDFEKCSIIASFFSEFKDGLKYVSQNRLLKAFIIFFAMINGFLCVVNVGLPFVQLRFLEFSNSQYSLVQSAFVWGAIVAGLVYAKKKIQQPLKFVWKGNIFVGILLVALGLVPMLFQINTVVWIGMVVLNATLGFVLSGINIPYSVWLSETVPVKMQGRVFSFISVTSQILQPIGIMVFGLFYSIETGFPKLQNFLIFAFCGLFISLFSLLYVRIREIRL